MIRAKKEENYVHNFLLVSSPSQKCIMDVYIFRELFGDNVECLSNVYCGEINSLSHQEKYKSTLNSGMQCHRWQNQRTSGAAKLPLISGISYPLTVHRHCAGAAWRTECHDGQKCPHGAGHQRKGEVEGT